MPCMQRTHESSFYSTASSTDPRSVRDPQILDPSRREITHPAMNPDMSTLRPRLLNRSSGTDMFDLTFDVFVHDDFECCAGVGVGEVEGGDEGGEGGEPAGEGGRGVG